ncbi:MAG: alpha/beta hydrolase [Actinomycetaceae bacterium]|nr:alpha/beta hydrolase [Actinomycetaceae bacterium]
MTRGIFARLGAAAAALGLVVSLGACRSLGSSGTADSETNPLTGKAEVPAGLEKIYAQQVQWGACDEDVDTHSGASCATLHVPLDYDNPQGQTIDVLMARVKATGTKIGTLFVNPGGPGGSGVQFLANLVDVLPGSLRDHYDIVGFDPRGVGHSTPVTCLDDAGLDAMLDGTFRAPEGDDAWKVADEVVRTLELPADPPPGVTAEDQRTMAMQVASWAKACHNQVGDLLDHVDTVSTARDLDVMRAAVGDEKLAYLGYSYGTYLGQIYIDLFPDNVGRLVLDGVLAAGASMDEVAEIQAVGLEESLRHFVEYCRGQGHCPLTGTTDEGMRQISEFVAALADNPLPAKNSDRVLTEQAAFTALIGPLYNTSSYSSLNSALTAALEKHDAAAMLALADAYTGRLPEGGYDSNSNEAFNAINALDYPVVGGPKEWLESARRLAEKAPVLGPSMGYAAASQLAWGAREAPERKPVTGKGAQPVLLVNALHDPATPLAMAKDVHAHLDGSVLVTVDSWDHTTLATGSSCVDDLVAAYLLKGELPEGDRECH